MSDSNRAGRIAILAPMPSELQPVARAFALHREQLAARYVLTHPWRIPYLVKLGRDSVRAAHAAAAAARRAVDEG